jgi:hypothetical protein
MVCSLNCRLPKYKQLAADFKSRVLLVNQTAVRTHKSIDDKLSPAEAQ